MPRESRVYFDDMMDAARRVIDYTDGMAFDDFVNDRRTYVDKYYIAARYPTYKESVRITQRRIAEGLFAKTRETFRWLSHAFGFKK